jgi:uncharacterized protein YjbI with pentapeptide repeats
VKQEREQKQPGERGRAFIRELLVPDWLPTRNQVLWSIRITIGSVILLGVLERIGNYYDKTLWNWATILLVPAVLAIGGYWFNRRQQERDQRNAEQRAQDEALQAYLDQMSQLLIEKDLHTEENRYVEARVTARARTLVVLRQLDDDRKDRKKSVLQFLYEAQLINKERKLSPLSRVFEPRVLEARVIRLDGAELRNASLRYITLSGAALDGAILENADLRNTYLSGIDLGGSYLSGADLSGADLKGASLVNADLQRKDARGLEGADLTGADLTGTDLTGADLSGAIGVTAQQLGKCKSLAGATMPNGQKYEDWLKDR